MARPSSSQPTDGELEILRILWEAGPSPLGAICQAICQQRPVANTTVATMLRIMLDKGLVRRSQGPRGYVWSARVSRAVAAKLALRRLVDGVFDGSARRLVAHLLEHERLTENDREAIRRMLESSDEPRDRS